MEVAACRRYWLFGAEVVVEVVRELAPVDCKVVDCVTDTDGIIARIGDVAVSTIVFAGLWSE